MEGSSPLRASAPLITLAFHVLRATQTTRPPSPDAHSASAQTAEAVMPAAQLDRPLESQPPATATDSSAAAAAAPTSSLKSNSDGAEAQQQAPSTHQPQESSTKDVNSSEVTSPLPDERDATNSSPRAAVNDAAALADGAGAADIGAVKAPASSTPVAAAAAIMLASEGRQSTAQQFQGDPAPVQQQQQPSQASPQDAHKVAEAAAGQRQQQPSSQANEAAALPAPTATATAAAAAPVPINKMTGRPSVAAMIKRFREAPPLPRDLRGSWDGPADVRASGSRVHASEPAASSDAAVRTAQSQGSSATKPSVPSPSAGAASSSHRSPQAVAAADHSPSPESRSRQHPSPASRRGPASPKREAAAAAPSAHAASPRSGDQVRSPQRAEALASASAYKQQLLKGSGASSGSTAADSLLQRGRLLLQRPLLPPDTDSRASAASARGATSTSRAALKSAIAGERL